MCICYVSQIGLKAEWRGYHGRMVLFLGNKNTSSLGPVKAMILPPSHLKMELSLVPETIPARAQVRTILVWLSLLNIESYSEPVNFVSCIIPGAMPIRGFKSSPKQGYFYS